MDTLNQLLAAERSSNNVLVECLNRVRRNTKFQWDQEDIDAALAKVKESGS